MTAKDVVDKVKLDDGSDFIYMGFGPTRVTSFL
jgi:hypothetical protein